MRSLRSDLKWVVGLAFFLCALAAALTYSLFRLSTYETASGTAAAVIRVMIRGPLEDDELLAHLQEAARADPQARCRRTG